MLNIDVIVAVGSVDGILTTAVLLRAIGDTEGQVPVVFTQAFLVDKIDPTKWQANRRVAFVDLAVNNQKPEMTADFVRRIREAGHTIVAIIDEHDDEAWAKLWGHRFSDLEVWPVTGEVGEWNFRSSGMILERALKLRGLLDDHSCALCDAADAADQGQFVGIGDVVNRAVKANMFDDKRRLHLARRFAFNVEPDETILGWVAEYAEMVANHAAIIAARQDLGDGIIRVSALGADGQPLRADMTTVLFGCYKLPGVAVVVYEGVMFNPVAKRQEVMVSLATGVKTFDLITPLKAAGISCGGFAQKANLGREDEDRAIAVIRKLLG